MILAFIQFYCWIASVHFAVGKRTGVQVLAPRYGLYFKKKIYYWIHFFQLYAHESADVLLSFVELEFQVELVDPPASAKVGKKVTFPGYSGESDILNSKSKSGKRYR